MRTGASASRKILDATMPGASETPGGGATTDRDLLRPARGGDKRAFGGLVEGYRTLVWSRAYSAAHGNLVQTEEMVQEVFVVAWEKLAQLRDPGQFRPWLHGIIRNLTLRLPRSRVREASMRSGALAEADLASG